MYTIETAKKAFDHVFSVQDDVEEAHEAEDAAYFNFIQAIANGQTEGDLKEMAAQLVKISEIDFPRYCA